MNPAPKNARRQLARFLAALFLPDEIIELRFIESWLLRGRKRSRVVRPALWLRTSDFLSQHAELVAFARRTQANIYCGVCPRERKGDSHDESIKVIRCIWCDMDDVDIKEAEDRWRDADIPCPSLVVRSGSGIHGYWLLQRALQTPQERSRFLAMVPHFYKSFGGDHVQNLSRVLRPPGTLNFKDARNGRSPLPCTLLACDTQLRYPWSKFSRWVEIAEHDAETKQTCCPSGATDAGQRRAIQGDRAEAIDLVSRLDRGSPDRSRRDFAIVCDLLRLGLAKEQIWDLVSEKSKFESNGRSYFEVTFANAERTLLLDEASPARLQISSG